MKPVENVIPFFESNQIRNKLEMIYGSIPGGNCAGSARCCCESVNCFYSEYLNVVSELRTKNLFALYEERAIRYWFSELSVAMDCPLLTEKRLCSVYESRPLPCRVFGHLNQNDFEENSELIREQNCDAAEELLQEFGIIVPESVTCGQVGFCENFSSDRGMSADDRDDLIDQLFGVESTFLMDETLEMDEFNFRAGKGK